MVFRLFGKDKITTFIPAKAGTKNANLSQIGISLKLPQPFKR